MRYSQFGLTLYDRVRATPGFTLLVPHGCHEVYLLGMRGEILHHWTGLPLGPGNYAHLLANGNLLWAGRTAQGNLPDTGGKGGLLREYDWDGKVVWEHRDDNQHHDFRRLPNGNTVYIGWEAMTRENIARVKGGVPGKEKDGMIYGDYIREVDPSGKTVWEWHAQDLEIERYPLNMVGHREEFAHCNAVFPMPDGGVMLSFRKLSTIMIIDRASGKPRWEMRDDGWGQQHDCTLLDNGNILFFANGQDTGAPPHSRVLEIEPKTKQTVWEYKGDPPWTFFSPHISGAQRLASGNTLVCEGQWGRIFEVTPHREIVWEYINPFHGRMPTGTMSNWVFRAYRYAADSPQIAGRLGRVET
ncbi:MAG: aryl-sulfate sulfotransferase [Burkholderiales bacterium]|nr:aryl-sulfate sulfotransferase [Burkholderiales bacterium]